MECLRRSAGAACVIALLSVGAPWPAPAAAAGLEPGPDEVGGYATTGIVVQTRTRVRPALRAGRLTLTHEATAARGKAGARVAGAESSAVADTLSRFGAVSIEPIFEHGFANPQLARQIGLDRYYRVTVPEGTDTPAMVDDLRRFGTLVERAELDGIGGVADTIPNDPDFDLLWGMQNTGQDFDGVAGTIGADINVTPAWDITTGAGGLVLAVLDAGMGNHVEIANRMIPGKNVAAHPDNDDTSDVCNSHGTHVAGTAAATGNNGTGVAGVDWACSIMPVRVLNNCSGIESHAAEGIVWATDNGADVINMSLQYTTGSTVLEDAVEYAYAQGVPILAATGNQGGAQVKFPARWPETVAVGAIDNTGDRALFSNMGPNLDVMAPGNWVRSLFNIAQYSFKSGTSMATPHVAGTVLLMKGINPDLTPCEIKEILWQTAVDIDPPKFDEATGYGRIDALEALLASQPTIPGDLDRDGAIGVGDLLILLGAWGPCSAECPPTCPADFDDSADVTVNDLLYFLAQWPLDP